MTAKGTRNILAAFILGASAGSVAALLLATTTGAESRKKVKETWERTKKKALDGFGQVKEFTQTRKRALEEAMHQGNEAYRQGVQEKVSPARETDITKLLEAGADW